MGSSAPVGYEAQQRLAILLPCCGRLVGRPSVPDHLVGLLLMDIDIDGIFAEGSATLRIDDERTRTREVDAVRRCIIGHRVFVGMLQQHRARILGCYGAHHFLGIRSNGQRVGIVDASLLLVDVELIVAACDGSLGDAVRAVALRHIGISVERSEREGRDGRVVVIGVLLFAAA